MLVIEQMKEKNKIDAFFKFKTKSPYQEIIDLLERFKELKFHHLMFFLSSDKNYDKKEIETELQNLFFKNTNRFFKNKKEIKNTIWNNLIKKHKKNIIHYPQHLTIFLKKMIDDLGWLETKGKPRYYTYYLSDRFFIEEKKQEMISELTNIHYKNIHFLSFDPERMLQRYINKDYKNDEVDNVFYLYVFAKKQKEIKINDKTKKTINDSIDIINKEIIKIKEKLEKQLTENTKTPIIKIVLHSETEI